MELLVLALDTQVPLSVNDKAQITRSLTILKTYCNTNIKQIKALLSCFYISNKNWLIFYFKTDSSNAYTGIWLVRYKLSQQHIRKYHFPTKITIPVCVALDLHQFTIFLSNFLKIDLLSVLRGHSVFSSPPQRPMPSDFEGFSIPDFIHYIIYLS